MIYTRPTLMLLCGLFCLGVCVAPSAADTISVAIAADMDDVEENLDNGSFDQPSSDLELGTEGPPVGRQSVGMRFLNIGIPNGATINSAHIQFMVDESDDEVTNVRITGELSPNSAPFELTPLNISSRTRTSNSVVWNNIPLWTNEGDSGPDQRTPDISSIVQEIIGQPGWVAGNVMTFIIEPDPISYADGERTAISFEKASGNPNFNPPILNVEFVPEPSSLVLAGLGFVGLLGLSRRKR